MKKVFLLSDCKTGPSHDALLLERAEKELEVSNSRKRKTELRREIKELKERFVAHGRITLIQERGC